MESPSRIQVERKGRYVLGFLMLSLTLGFSIGGEVSNDAPTADWCEGPTRYLLMAQGDKAYKKAKTEEKRGKLIAEFWAQRDPTPGTPENEYRDSFYERVKEANSRFNEPGNAGWATDRGMILLTAGYPDTRSGVDGTGERWLYQRSFPVKGIQNPDVKVSVTFSAVFDKSASGEYKMVRRSDGSGGLALLEGIQGLSLGERVKFSMHRTAMPETKPE